jgi:hypothetical protein
MRDSSDIQEELERARDQQRLNVPAKSILRNIQSIPSDIDKLQRRWFWELLQNASDYNDEVEVELELFADKVIFKHNGKPFRPIDTENLIAPDSGKDDEETRTEGTIGQFGTGFVSTHVLSSNITVNGVVKSEGIEVYHSFKFTLDRSGFTNKELLKDSISLASKELSSNVKPVEYSAGSFDTTFTYHLNKNLPGINPGQAVSAGLEYVYEVLPYTLAFMPRIKKVTIKNHQTQFVKYVKRIFTPNDRGEQFSVLIGTQLTSESGITESNSFFETKKVGEATVIVRIEDGRILPYPEKLTKLFCSLPMIGTEDFSSPIALNSEKFVPKTERDGVKLSYNDTVNRAIISSGTIAYKSLVDKLVQDNVDGFYNIARWTYYNGDNNEKHWFSEKVINPLKNHLLNTQVVRTSKSRITLGKVKIPYFTSDELKKGKLQDFYTICAEYMPTLIPVQGDFQNWFDNIDFNVFKTCKYELKELLKEIDELGSLNAIAQKVSNSKEWLVKLIELTIVVDINLLDQFKIIPNQSGEFVFKKDEVYYDDSLNSDLIDIYDAMHDTSYRSFLLDKSFEGIAALLPENRTKKESDISKAIDDCFSEIPEPDRTGAKFQKGLQLMFKWLSECGKNDSELKELFKWFSQKKPQLFLETIQDSDRDKVLSIAQSGKLSSLSKLAESNITNEDLTTITSNVEDVVQLAKVLENVDGGMNILLQYAKQIKKDDEDFKFKKEIGEKVERIFKEALLNSGINSQFTKLDHDGRGSHDFEITNKINGKKFYIELKSYEWGSNSSLKLAPSQAKEGLNNPSNFCLAMIERPEPINPVTEQYIKTNLISKTNIGDFVQTGLENFEKLKEIETGNNLYLTFREPIRVIVEKHHINNGGMNFYSLIQKIKIYIQ